LDDTFNSSCYTRPSSFVGLRIAVLLISGKIIVVIFVHCGVVLSLFLGRSCAGARSNAQQTISARLSQNLLSETQEKSFDLGSTDSRGSPTVVNLWIETDVFYLRKLYAQLKHYDFDKVKMLPPVTSVGIAKVKAFLLSKIVPHRLYFLQFLELIVAFVFDHPDNFQPGTSTSSQQTLTLMFPCLLNINCTY
jgi:hypothetical protein